MSDLKTKPTNNSVNEFIKKIENKTRQSDALVLLTIMQEITQQPAILWGTSIVGFGTYQYRYESGREGQWMKIGFSPRKAYMTLYIMNGFNNYQNLLDQLGKYKTTKSCLSINKLADVNLDILKKIISGSYQYMSKKYGK